MIYIGIDFNSYSIKAVVIKTSGGKKWRILNTHFFPIQPDKNEEQQLALRSEHLKVLSALYNNQEVRYIFCFPQNVICTHKIEFPFKERRKMMKTLPFEMEDRTLFNYKELISDIKILHSVGEKTPVLVFSVFRKHIIDALQQLQSVGINPYILTCEAECMINILEKPIHLPVGEDKKSSDGVKNQDYDLYINMGYEHTVATLFIEGQLRDVYSFAWGVSSCIRKIASKYEISMKTAFEQFQEKAFVVTSKRGYTGSQIVFSGLIQDALGHFVQKIRLLLLKQEGEQDLKCQRIFIYGEGTQIRNLQAVLSSHWEIPVVRVENLPNYPDWNLRENDKNQNDLSTALGAALEGLKKIKNPAINFLREEFTVRFNPITFLSPQWRQLIMTGMVVLVLFFSYSYLRNQQSEKLSSGIQPIFKRYSSRITRLPPHKISVSGLHQFINSKKNLFAQTKLTEDLASIPSVLDGIKDISLAIRRKPFWNLEIQQLSIQDKKIEIQGWISKPYLKELENSLNSIAEKGSLKMLPTDKSSENSGIKATHVDKDEQVIFFTYLFTKNKVGL